MIIGKIEAEKILTPYIPSFTKVIDQAVAEFKSDPKKIFYCNRTKACIINDLILKYALIELTGLQGIRFSQKHGNTYVIVRDKFIVRFKKLDDRLRTSNIPTKQAERFLRQQLLWSDSEVPPPATNIFAGYTWSSAQNDYNGIFITCPRGKVNEWYLDLGSEQIPIAEVLPFRSPDTNANNRRRAKPRKADQNEKANNDQK